MRCLLIVALLVASLHPSFCAQAKWTVLIYVNADNNLEQFSGLNLEQMSQAGSKEGVLEIFALVDRSANPDYFTGPFMNIAEFTDGKYIHVVQGKLEEITVAGAAAEPNMDDGNVLTNFIKEGASRYPADNYALFMWDHGKRPS
jgi:hypothetical protein